MECPVQGNVNPLKERRLARMATVSIIAVATGMPTTGRRMRLVPVKASAELGYTPSDTLPEELFLLF